MKQIILSSFLVACLPTFYQRIIIRFLLSITRDYSRRYQCNGLPYHGGLLASIYEGDDITAHLSQREFLEVVGRAVHDVQQEPVDIVNIVFRVIWGNRAMSQLSLPTTSVNNLDAVIDNLEIEDYDYFGFDAFAVVLRLSHINTSWFLIISRDTQGGAGEAAVSHTLCYRMLSHQSDGDCLYKCLEHLSGNQVPRLAAQSMRDVNEISALYGIEVGVYEDRYNVEC